MSTFHLFRRIKNPNWQYPVLLFFFALTIFWRVIFTGEYSMLTYKDCAFQTYPWFQYMAGVSHHGSFPFWDPYTDGGKPFLGETQTGAFYPLNLLFSLLPLNSRGLLPVSVIEGFAILHCILASLLMYTLARHLGLLPFSALVSGLVFAYSGSIGMRAFAQQNILNTSIWVPAVFLCYSKALQAARWTGQVLYANLAGLFLALCLLGGHHQPFLYCGLAVALVAVALWFLNRTSRFDASHASGPPKEDCAGECL